MGGAPCWIIINCGPLGTTAATLANAKGTVPNLANAATYLAGVESEICELGDGLSPLLSSEEKAKVLTAGDDAEAMRARIFDHLFTPKAKKITAKDLLDFAETQRKFFLGLAAAHRND